MPYKLTTRETVTEGLVRCAREQLDGAILALTDELEDDPVAAVHSARKAIKKERAVLRLARGSVDRKQRRAENATLRELARALSGMRDAEVMLQALDGLTSRYDGQLPQDRLAVVRSFLEGERDAERAKAAPVDGAVSTLREVRSRVSAWQFSSEGWAAIKPGLERTYREGRAAMRLAAREPSLENLHEWRKRVKDTWYEIRLLGGVCGPTVAGTAAQAGALGELLGEDHDLGVLREKVRSTGADVLAALIDERREELQTQALAGGRGLYVEKPKAFLNRLSILWAAAAGDETVAR